MKCSGCQGAFLRHELVSTEYVPTKRRNKSTRKVSDVQERWNAKKAGGRTTIASGQTPVDKGDWKIPGVVRGEDKGTSKKSYSLKKTDLDKLIRQATGDEIPVFSIEFMEEGVSRAHTLRSQFRVIPAAWFDPLLQDYLFVKRLREEEPEVYNALREEYS